MPLRVQFSSPFGVFRTTPRPFATPPRSGEITNPVQTITATRQDIPFAYGCFSWNDHAMACCYAYLMYQGYLVVLIGGLEMGTRQARAR
jgi:hypothetical protein